MIFLSNILLKIKAHKIIAGAVVVGLVVAAVYGVRAFSGTASVTTYNLAAVIKGAIVSTLSGSGQVSAKNQVDLKPQASGVVYSINVVEGQEVKAGALLVSLNAKDALKSVRDAQTSLESANMAMEQLKAAADPLTLLQAENSLVAAKQTLAELRLNQPIDYQKAVEAKNDATTNVTKAYDDAYNSVTTAFLELPGIISGIQSLVYGTDFDRNQANIDYYVNIVGSSNGRMVSYRNSVDIDYRKARSLYDKNFIDYKSSSRDSSGETKLALVTQTYETTKVLADTVKNMNNLIQYYKDYLTNLSNTVNNLANTQLTTLNSYTGKTNTYLGDLLSAKSTISSSEQNLVNATNDLKKLDQTQPFDLLTAEKTVKEKELSLQNLKAGADKYALRNQEITISQRQNALYDANATLADYSIRSPFDGVVAVVAVKKGDSASSGTAAVTMITKERIAELSFNEVDIAKLKIGQKATLTFDAIDSLSISGQIVQLDTLGTVSQGVSTYKVQISFDTEDDRVKPGMSVAATIILDSKIDVLIVPNAAVKSNNSGSYVEMPNDAVSSNNLTGVNLTSGVKNQSVEIGLVDETNTEVVSGLLEGDIVIIKTNSSSTKTTTTQSSGASLFGGGGMRVGGGGR